MTHDAENRRQQVAPQVSIAHLPPTHRELFGRDADLAWLDACWEGGVHVATVVAESGAGKTALVNAWLARMGDDGSRRAERVYGWSFDNRGIGSCDEFMDAALRWFGDVDPRAGSPWEKGKRLAALVGKRRTLLVLDGVELLQWPSGADAGRFKDPAFEALVTELAAQNKGVCLITSRIRPHRGSSVHVAELGALSPEAGAKLLAARGVTGTAEDLRQASAEYKGHGLALTLLGSYLADVYQGDVRRREEIERAQDDARNSEPERIIAAYGKRFEGQAEILVLRMLGLFDRPATRREISALLEPPSIPGLTEWTRDKKWWWWMRVWDPANDTITADKLYEAAARLQKAGLLTPSSSAHGDGLDAHPRVREHFRAEFRRTHADAWSRGHRRLYEHLGKAAKPQPETIPEMVPLYSAASHCCQAGYVEVALGDVYWARISRGKKGFNAKNLGALTSEATLLSAAFRPPWQRFVPDLSKEAQDLVLSSAQRALLELGWHQEVADLMRLRLNRGIGMEDWGNAADAAFGLAVFLRARGQLRDGLAQARRSVEFPNQESSLSEGLTAVVRAIGFREGPSDTSQGRAQRAATYLAGLAAALTAVGSGEEAARHFEDAERILGAPLFSLAGYWYCDLLLDRGADADVRERATQTLEWGAARYSPLATALDHISLGRAHFLAAQRGTDGHLAQAASHLQQAVDCLRRSGDQDELPLGLIARAALHTHTCAFDRARDDLDEALSLTTRRHLRLHEADAHLGYARLCLAEGRLKPAGEHLAEARAIIEQTGYHRRDGELAALSARYEEEIKRRDAEAQRRKKVEEEIKTPLPLAPVAPRAVPSEIAPPPPTPTPSIATPMTNSSSFSQRLLEATEIQELHAAVLSANLTASRGALLAGIDSGFVASLPIATNHAAQIMLDLDGLATAGALRDGTVPLRTWLANAAHLAGPRVEAAVFVRYRDRVAASTPSRPEPPAVEAMSADQLLDALSGLLPAQFERLVFKLDVPVADISGPSAPQGTRSVEVLRWARHSGRIADVVRVLANVTGAGKKQ